MRTTRPRWERRRLDDGRAVGARDCRTAEAEGLGRKDRGKIDGIVRGVVLIDDERVEVEEHENERDEGAMANRTTDDEKPEPATDLVWQYLKRKVDEWMEDGPEEVLRVLCFWARKPPGDTPRVDLGDVEELLQELAELYGDDET